SHSMMKGRRWFSGLQAFLTAKLSFMSPLWPDSRVGPDLGILPVQPGRASARERKQVAENREWGDMRGAALGGRYDRNMAEESRYGKPLFASAPPRFAPARNGLGRPPTHAPGPRHMQTHPSTSVFPVAVEEAEEKALLTCSWGPRQGRYEAMGCGYLRSRA